MKNLTILLLLALFSKTLFSQTEQIWNLNIGGSSDEYINSTKLNSNSNYILTGQTSSNNFDFVENQGFNDIFICEVSNSGEVLMTNTIGGSSFDIGWDVIEEENNGYLIVGETFSNDGDINSPNNFGDAIICRTDQSGEIVWVKTYGGSVNEFFTNIHSSDNGYLVTGTSYSTDGDLINTNEGKLWVAEIDHEGNMLWSKKYGNDFNGFSFVSKKAQNSDILLGGITFNSQTNNDEIQLLRIDKEGNELWSYSLNGNSGDFIEDIEETKNGDIIISAQTYSDDFPNLQSYGSSDIIVVALTSTGDIKWMNTFGDEGLDLGSRIGVKSNNNINILFTRGEIGINEPGSTDNIGLSNLRIVEIDENGQLISQTEIGGSSQDLSSGLLFRDNSLIIAANTVSSDGDIGSNYGSYDGWISNYETSTVSTTEEEIQSNTDIFPNPFKNSVSIKSDERIIKTEIYNSNGALVKYNNNPNLNTVHLDTNNLPNGIYLIKCTFNTGIITKKIISNN